MKTLFKGGSVVDVFTDEVLKADVLVSGETIAGVGTYGEDDADAVVDVSGKFICPGFIDGHMHIESSMLKPYELARALIPHGTSAIVADPHEIANVCGTDGIRYMLAASEGLPMDVYVMLPSCVPASPLDESGAVLRAADLEPFYADPRVLGLAEMMNYPGLLAGDEDIFEKIADAKRCGKIVNGHAPLLTGRDLDAYIAAGVGDDHECSRLDEAMERIRKGQAVMIRQGTAARNLAELLPLFAEPWSRSCMLVTDDVRPLDILHGGHIDGIIREAVSLGKPVLTAIRMATIQAARHFGLRGIGAVAPGYRADLLVLDSLPALDIAEVWHRGRKAAENGRALPFDAPAVPEDLEKAVRETMHTRAFTPADFRIEPVKGDCRVIRLVPGQLLTEEMLFTPKWDENNGIDAGSDILRIAVIERHKNTGHIGLGFIRGLGMKRGALASSISHDSHNLIVVGANTEDMAIAANRARETGGGNVVADGGRVVAEIALPIAGLMTDGTVEDAAYENLALRDAVMSMGMAKGVNPFLTTAFMSLSVIPFIKITTRGLVDVIRQEFVPLNAE